jgi:hypothetical protein
VTTQDITSTNGDDDPQVSSRETTRWGITRLPWIAPLIVAVSSALGLHLLERTFRLSSPQLLTEGYRFQDWTSNWTMQTLGLEEMAPFGPKALLYDHIYPPFLDAMRFVLMLPETNAGQPPSQMAVDFRLYATYAVFFGLINAMVYLWVRDLTKSGWWALGATFIWAISPGFLTIMMLLEPTPPALLFIVAAFYFLYRFLKTRRLGYATSFFAAVLLASVTRNLMQPHFFAVILAALIAFWFMSSKRAWWTQALNVVLVGLMVVLPFKQYLMYDTFDTSTYGGYHRVGPLWIDPRTVADVAYPQDIVDNALAFSSRYNTQETLKDHYRLSAAADRFVAEHPVEAVQNLARSLTITMPEIARPTSDYTQNYLVATLPWRAAFDWVFSSWRYLLLIIAAALIIIQSRGRAGSLRLLRRYGWFLAFFALLVIPVIWSNRYRPGEEDLGPVWTEATRLKIFLEVPVFVCIAYAAWLLTPKGRKRAAQAESTSPSLQQPTSSQSASDAVAT